MHYSVLPCFIYLIVQVIGPRYAHAQEGLHFVKDLI